MLLRRQEAGRAKAWTFAPSNVDRRTVRRWIGSSFERVRAASRLTRSTVLLDTGQWCQRGALLGRGTRSVLTAMLGAVLIVPPLQASEIATMSEVPLRLEAGPNRFVMGEVPVTFESSQRRPWAERVLQGHGIAPSLYQHIEDDFELLQVSNLVAACDRAVGHPISENATFYALAGIVREEVAAVPALVALCQSFPAGFLEDHQDAAVLHSLGIHEVPKQGVERVQALKVRFPTYRATATDIALLDVLSPMLFWKMYALLEDLERSGGLTFARGSAVLPVAEIAKLTPLLDGQPVEREINGRSYSFSHSELLSGATALTTLQKAAMTPEDLDASILLAVGSKEDRALLSAMFEKSEAVEHALASKALVRALWIHRANGADDASLLGQIDVLTERLGRRPSPFEVGGLVRSLQRGTAFEALVPEALCAELRRRGIPFELKDLATLAMVDLDQSADDLRAWANQHVKPGTQRRDHNAEYEHRLEDHADLSVGELHKIKLLTRGLQGGSLLATFIDAIRQTRAEDGEVGGLVTLRSGRVTGDVHRSAALNDDGRSFLLPLDLDPRSAITDFHTHPNGRHASGPSSSGRGMGGDRAVATLIHQDGVTIADLGSHLNVSFYTTNGAVVNLGDFEVRGQP